MKHIRLINNKKIRQEDEKSFNILSYELDCINKEIAQLSRDITTMQNDFNNDTHNS